MSKFEIFLSYCWSDDEIAGKIETSLAKNDTINLHRDKLDIGTWRSIKEYIHSIKKDDSKVSAFVKYFVSYISIKMEENVSVEKYNLRISEVIQREKDSFASENLIEYMKYKLYLKEYFPVDVLPVLVFESNLSMIDRYCNLIRIMRNMENEISDYSQNLIIDNLADIKDDLSARILKKNVTKLVLPILDKYTKGDYDQVVKLCSQELERSPYLVDLYPIYIRAHIRLNSDDQIWPEGSLLSIILNGLKDMYLSTSKFDEAYSNLKKISYIFCNNEWAWQLRGLIEDVSNYNRNDKLIKLYKKHVQPDNPLYVRTSAESNTEKSDQIEMSTGYESSITLKLYEYINSENIYQISILITTKLNILFQFFHQEMILIIFQIINFDFYTYISNIHIHLYEQMEIDKNNHE